MRYPPRAARPAAAVIALVAVLVCPAAQQAGGRAEKLEQIRRLVRAEMAAKKIPGLSVAAADDFTIFLDEGFGLADVENSVPAKASTVYRLASISKPITAVAVVQLAERGRLDLDAPIQKYVPSFPEKPWPVTARALLSHTSGVRHYASAEEVGSTRHYLDLLEPLKIFRDDPLLFEPGTRFSYSTYGFSLLGAAVESASGMRFLDYLKQNVFAPAKMQHTLQDDTFEIVPWRARGYRLGPGGVLRNCALADTSNKVPGGGMLSTAEDLVRFTAAVARAQVLKRETVDAMFTPFRLRDGTVGPYGLGWAIDQRGGRKWVSHSGLQQGVSTMLVSSPREGVIVVLLANLEGANLGPLALRIAEMILE